MDIKQGDIIFKQGEKGNEAYLIEKGQIEIFHNHKDEQEVPLAVLGEGELFGEMALIDSNIRSASARALSDGRLLIIEKSQLVDKINTSDAVVQLMMRILLHRLRDKNQIAAGGAFSPRDVEKPNTIAVERLRLENQIFQALQKEEFRIYHQPIFDLNTLKIYGSEALIRWESPTNGLVSPGQFVDVLENSSTIIPVGYWIFEECFRHYNRIKEQCPDLPFSVSINVSGRQFAHHSFVETLKSLLLKHKVKAENFKLEITERILVEGGAVIDILNQCHDLGFKISLDDFGTGFSSLQYLAQMPIDYLKIDRSFVKNVAGDDKTRAVVSSIIFLAKELDLKIISEGIESETEATAMRVLGSDFGQGYLYSKPLDFDSFLKTLLNN
jgi:diguanylate cyclase